MQRAQGRAPPSLEAPVQQAPDSLCDSASPESTSGTCSSAWRMKEGPVTHSSSIKASSNSTCIKMSSSTQWHSGSRADRQLRAQTLSAGTFFDHPLLNDETSDRGKRIIWNTERTSAFKSLFKHRPFCISSEEVEQILELGPDFSVPLSSVCSSETSCTQPHFTHALPHAAHKRNVFN